MFSFVGTKFLFLLEPDSSFAITVFGFLLKPTKTFVATFVYLLEPVYQFATIAFVFVGIDQFFLPSLRLLEQLYHFCYNHFGFCYYCIVNCYIHFFVRLLRFAAVCLLLTPLSIFATTSVDVCCFHARANKSCK